MVCPYSLTVPGGVQAQVLGLARELRRQGHEVRVLGPCDGPPPETFVTPLGNSLPTAANGSIAPLAPDASRRAAHDPGARRRGSSTSLHVHEPLRPGPDDDGGADAPGADGRHVPRRRRAAASYKVLDRSAALGSPGASTARSSCPRTPWSSSSRYLGGEYDILFNGVEIDRHRGDAADADGGPTIFFCGRHEERKGLAVLLEAFRLAPGRRRGCGSPATVRTARACAPSTPTTSGSRGSGGSATPRSSPACAGASVFCAPSLHGESFGVVLIEAMAAGTPVVASGLDGYRNVATDGVDALLVEPGDVDALADGARAPCSTTGCSPSRCAAPASAGPRRSR